VSSQLHASAWYPLDRRLGRKQSGSGRGGKEKKFPAPVVHPVTTPPEPPRLRVLLNAARMCVRGCIQKFPDWVITKYTLTTINTRWEITQRVMAVKLTRVTHKRAILVHLVAESCTICSSRSRRPVRKLFDTPSYINLCSWLSVRPSHYFYFI
jgi:hypothetical protein